jgi:hypothetical protein
MSIFQDITFSHKDKDYKIKSNQVMRLIAMIEDVITLQELTTQPRLSRLAEAYTVALNYAGADLSIDEVYASLFGDGGSARITEAVTNLVMMMLPPDSYNPENNGGKPEAVGD